MRYLYFCPQCKCETQNHVHDGRYCCGDCSDAPDPAFDVKFELYAIVEDGVRMTIVQPIGGV